MDGLVVRGAGVTIDPEHARALAGSLAASFRGQAEIGVTDVDVNRARALVRALNALISPPAEDAPPTQSPAERAARSDERSGARASSARAQRPAAADTSAPAGSDARDRSPDERVADNKAQEPARPSGAMPWATRDRAGRELGVGSDALRAIREDLGACTRCKLCERRANLVFGVGNPNARLMFIGEAPGADEDRKGEPFVGKAGQLLTKMIEAMTLRREDVYIANVIKCRPPGNRDPEPDEIGTCRPFLDRQIDAVSPELIVCLGRVAPMALLGREIRITKERGSWHEYRGIPMLLTLHPAYLLRNGAAKRDAWADLQQVMKRLGLSRPAR